VEIKGQTRVVLLDDDSCRLLDSLSTDTLQRLTNKKFSYSIVTQSIGVAQVKLSNVR
jgi:hypothetical protein